MKKYPDIGELLEKKREHRRALADLPFEKKIEIVFKLQERRKFIKSGRVVNDSQQTLRSSDQTDICDPEDRDNS